MTKEALVDLIWVILPYLTAFIAFCAALVKLVVTVREIKRQSKESIAALKEENHNQSIQLAETNQNLRELQKEIRRLEVVISRVQTTEVTSNESKNT